MYMFTGLIVMIIPQGTNTSKHHIVPFKYIQFWLINHTSINLGGKSLWLLAIKILIPHLYLLGLPTHWPDYCTYQQGCLWDYPNFGGMIELVMPPGYAPKPKLLQGHSDSSRPMIPNSFPKTEGRKIGCGRGGEKEGRRERGWRRKGGKEWMNEWTKGGKEGRS